MTNHILDLCVVLLDETMNLREHTYWKKMTQKQGHVTNAFRFRSRKEISPVIQYHPLLSCLVPQGKLDIVISVFIVEGDILYCQ